MRTFIEVSRWREWGTREVTKRLGEWVLDLTWVLRPVRMISMLPSVEGNNLSIREILSEGLPLYILCE